MATKPFPTLRRIKRRNLRGATLSRLGARPPTPIPGYYSQNATTSATVVAGCGTETEEIHSEEVEASTSRFFCFDDAETLEDKFPSILRLVKSMGQVYQENDVAAFANLARVFTTNANDITSCIAQSEFVDPTREQFILAKCIVRLLLDMFESSWKVVGNSKSHRDRDRQLEMRNSFEYAKLVYESLALFYQSGRNKPLPPLPPSQVFHVPQPLGAPHLPAARSNLTVNTSGRAAYSRSEHKSQRKKENGSARPVMKHRSSLPCLRVDSYNQRHTILFFGEAKMPSTFPYVDDGREALRSNKGNRVQAVSVSSLVSIITSGESTATDLELVQAVLASFRLFITPTEFFHELKQRFELATVPKSANQGHVEISKVRGNVFAVIYSWLDQHWQVDSDSVVLGEIRAFVENQSEGKLITLLDKITAREQCSMEDVLDERKRHIASTTPARTPAPDCTNFVFPRNFHPSSDGLLQLNTDDDGREELSRHLTLKMSHLYRQLDPIKVVEFWYKEGDSCRMYEKFQAVPGVKELAAISAYGERLTLWVISSILEIEKVEGRVDRISLWVDVALRCMMHRDYATAHNIYASLSYSAVIRLQTTILSVSYATKSQYVKLEHFFEKKGISTTFDDLRPSLPSTAPLIKNIIHTKSTTEKDKTTSPESATHPSNSKEKFICFDECRVTQQATKVLNKALMEYKFYENNDLSRWLDERLKEFCTVDTKIVYEKLHDKSRQREPTQVNLHQLNQFDPWKCHSSNPCNPLKGTLVALSFGAEKREQKKANVLFTLLKALAFG